MTEYNVYFDLETFKEGLESEFPTVETYGVVCSWHKGTVYDERKLLNTRVFIGVTALEQFLDYLELTFKPEGEPKTIHLYAYNMPYDFCVMRRQLLDYWELKDLKVLMSDTKKLLLSGHFVYKNLRFELHDLNMFQKTYALASWIAELNDKYAKDERGLSVKYLMNGEKHEEFIAKKLKIDYDKWDLYEDPKEQYYGEFRHINKMYYRTSLGEEKLLDIQQEWDYILIDGLAMPWVFREIYKTKTDFLKIIREEFEGKFNEIELRDMFRKYGFWKKQSVSAVSKCVCEMFIQEKFNDIYRFDLRDGNDSCRIASAEYLIQSNSLLGGLTVGNRDYATYTTKEGETIESYDVNSMYPYIMSSGMPAQNVRDDVDDTLKEFKLHNWELEGDYVVWCFIRGTIDGEEPYIHWKDVFEWKGKTINCPKFDNEILGKYFLDDNKIKHGFYVIKNYWELLVKTCDHNLRLVNLKYQYLDKQMARYIAKVNEIKMNSEKGTAQNTTAKLAMNSLYGKTLEGNHMYRVEYGRGVDQFRSQKRKIQANRRGFNLTLDGLHGILPVIEEDPVLPCRLAGVYVTNIARLLLLTGIFDEVANGNDFLYADTDSIKLIVRNPVTLFIDDVKLGKWKKEGSKKINKETKKPYYMEFNEWRYPLKTKRYAIWNNRFPIEMGRFAFAGMPARIRNEFKTSTERVEALFGVNSNILFIDGRTATKRNPETDQPIIYNVDLMTNNSIEPTHIAEYDIEKDVWTFEPFNNIKLKERGRCLVKKSDTYETNLLPGWFNRYDTGLMSEDQT